MVQAIGAASFVNSLGVDAHIGKTGVDDNTTNVLADLKYLGISSVRTYVPDPGDGTYQQEVSEEGTLAANSIKFDMLDGAPPSADIADLNTFAHANPGAIAAVEGPNEINNFPLPTYNGLNGEAAAIKWQEDLYADVHADSNLAGVPVYDYTGYGFDPKTPTPILQSGTPGLHSPGLADYDTQHPYPRNGQTPASTVARSVMYTNAADPSTIPGVITEEGYSTSTFGNGSNQTLQAHYQLDMLMDGSQEGIAAQCIYDLVNSDGFGLFNADNSATPTAIEIHNLTSILSANTSGTVAPGALNYSISGLGSNGNSFLMEKASGAFDVSVWAEPGILNGTPPTQNVTVNLGATYGTVEVFDPTQGTSPIKTLNNVSSVQVAITDHPVIVEVEPGSSQPPPPPSGGTTITIPQATYSVTENVSGDTIQATAGDHLLYLGGSNDTIHLFGGLDRYVETSGGHNTLVIPPAHNGTLTMGSAVLTNGDQFDLRPVLQAAGWDGVVGDIGKYLTTFETSSGYTDLQVRAAHAGGTASVVAAITGANINLTTLVAHSVT